MKFKVVFVKEVEEELIKIKENFLPAVRKFKKITETIERECNTYQDLQRKARIEKIVTCENGYKIEFSKQHRALITIEKDKIKIWKVFFETKNADYKKLLRLMISRGVFKSK